MKRIFTLIVLFGCGAVMGVRLELGVSNQMSVFDPLGSLKAPDRFILNLLFEPLVFSDSEHQLQPQLAESWEPSHDQKSLIIHLKKNRRFSDGSPITATEVKLALSKLCSSVSKASPELTGIKGCGAWEPTTHPEGMSTIRITGPHDLAIELGTSPAALIHQLAGGRAVIFKGEDGKWIGSGPFVMREHGTNRCLLDRNLYSLKSPQSKDVHLALNYVPERDLEDRLKSGSIIGGMMFLRMTTEKIRLADFNVLYHKPYVTQLLVLNPAIPALSKKSTRRSIRNYLSTQSKVENCALSDVKARGIVPLGLAGSIANVSDPAPTAPTASKKSARPLANVVVHRHFDRKFDCDESAVIAAGKASGIQFTFKHHTSYDTLWPHYAKRDLPAFMELLVFKNREAVSVLPLFEWGAKENFFNFNLPGINALIEKARNSPSGRQRYQVYKELFTQIDEEASVMPLYYLGHVDLVHRCVKGVPNEEQANPNPFAYLADIWWENGCRE